MLAFPSMLLSACDEEGIPTPNDDELLGADEDVNLFRESHPRFFIFCLLQLGRSMDDWGEHWHNASVIGKLSDEEAMKMTPEDFRNAGFRGI